MKVIAIIPARGGSKGLLRKNIKLLGNIPLIGYSIMEALKSKYINRVLVSTEDSEIAEISKQFGAEVPFMRPTELAEDMTSSMDVIIHMIEELKKREDYYAEIVTLLEPTSPFRKAEHIDETIRKLIEQKPDSVVTVCAVERKPSNIVKVTHNDQIIKYIEKPTIEYSRRQDWAHLKRINSAVYATWTDFILEHKKLIGDRCLMVEMNDIESINIDSIIDFKLAELVLKEFS
jgi:N-acylneuraminate cytidylyltransferase/CMP-N,N'-diacetyllegionaminic acid synthase